MGPRNGQLLQSFDEIGGIVVQRNGFRTRHRPFAGDGRPLWNEPAGSCSAETTTQTTDFWNNFGSLLPAVFAESQIPLINKIITVVFVINRRRLFHERAVATAFRTVYHPSTLVFRSTLRLLLFTLLFFWTFRRRLNAKGFSVSYSGCWFVKMPLSLQRPTWTRRVGFFNS